MVPLRKYACVRVVRLLQSPEHYGGPPHDERPPAVGDEGYIIEILQRADHPDGYLVESSDPSREGTNVWQCVFLAEELEPVERSVD
jgi:hypothetical protein